MLEGCRGRRGHARGVPRPAGTRSRGAEASGDMLEGCRGQRGHARGVPGSAGTCSNPGDFATGCSLGRLHAHSEAQRFPGFCACPRPTPPHATDPSSCDRPLLIEAPRREPGGRRAVEPSRPPEARIAPHHQPAQATFTTKQRPTLLPGSPAGRWAFPAPLPAFPRPCGKLPRLLREDSPRETTHGQVSSPTAPPGGFLR